MIRDEVSLSLEAYTTVLEQENLGEPHPTLIGGSRWYPPDARNDMGRRVHTELASQGLTQGSRPSDDLLETLAILQRAGVEYYTIANIEGCETTIRVAATGRDAVLVSCRDHVLRIVPVPVEQMGSRLAAALPTVPAAQAHSMSCDRVDLDQAMQNKDLPSTGSARDARRMKRWLDRERLNVGQLYAAVRDAAGTRRSTRSPVPVWIDTEEGRILLSPADNGWMNLVGADTVTLAGKFDELEKVLH